MRRVFTAFTATVLMAAPLFAQARDVAPKAGTKASDVFDRQLELQGLYDEISQATLQFENASDVDLLHSVLYTPDWVLVDAAGHTQTWPEVRAQAVQALAAPFPDSIVQPIQKLSVDSTGATAVVRAISVRTIVDEEGRYGRKGAPHTLTETTVFRDRWVSVDGGWRLKSREQIGQPTVVVDKPESYY